ERGSYRGLKVGETLPPEIRRLLEPLGVWTQFLADGHLRSPGITSMWGSKRPLDQDLIFNPYGSGWHVDREKFDRMLADAAVAAGAKLLLGAVVRSYHRGPEGDWRINVETLATSQELSGRGLVVAAGRNPCGLGQFGRRMHLDQLVGVVGFF